METRFLLAALVSLFLLGSSLSRQRASAVDSHIDAEIGLRATGLATALFGELSQLPFDGAGTVAAASDLTPAGQFGQQGAWNAATDLDDVHGVTATRSVADSGSDLFFNATATVQYVARSGGAFVPSATQTYHKEVVLQVVGPSGVTFTARRVFSYR